MSSMIGETLTDEQGKKWSIGKILGEGASGKVFTASDRIDMEVQDDVEFVIKWDSNKNGNLEGEIKFFQTLASIEEVEQWRKAQGLEFLGMPHYVASGDHHWEEEDHFFLVIPRYGKTLSQFMNEMPDGRLAVEVAVDVALQIIDILQYLQSKGYTHNDIKPENILLGRATSEPLRIHLVDYGLIQEYKESCNRNKANWGTIELMARDAHNGAFPLRGDLESLGFNLIEWTGGKLPWAGKTRPLASKTMFMKTLNLESLYSTPIEGLDTIKSFLEYVRELGHEDIPDYTRCKSILSDGFALGIPLAPKENILVSDTHKKVKTQKRKRPLQEDGVGNLRKRQRTKNSNQENGPIKSQISNCINENQAEKQVVRLPVTTQLLWQRIREGVQKVYSMKIKAIQMHLKSLGQLKKK
ncbi:unnamed protein product [Orchesella dallaii]|uniref:non-specific serine/threonine protein kinase n=1 Tax=Orchesella dallaii TaxID=48710 RepID=A0ABP1RP50_9HEXA